MNNDELQKAIDDITKDNAPVAEAAPAVDATAENEQLANELAGAAPAEAPVAEAAEFAPAPAPEVPAEPGMPPVAEAPVTETVAPEMAEAVAPAAPAVEEVAAVPEVKLGSAPMIDTTPAVAEAPASDNATLEEAMKELYPLLDKVEMPVEEKFDITMKYGEPAKALDLAKQFTDDTAKAKALLEIINKVK